MTMKRFLIILPLLLACTAAPADAQRNEAFNKSIKTIQVMANGDWELPPIIELGTDDYIEISFDELSHQYHRYTYKITHCNADWQPSELSELDYLEGFNGNTIDYYANSFNTTMLYTHYALEIPNEDVSITASGNYIVSVYDDDNGGEHVLNACFSVVEQQVAIAASVSSNTDIDTNSTHQQVSFSVNYGSYDIRNPASEVKVQVFQNQRRDNMVDGIAPTYQQPGRLQYVHNRRLIFDAGNEYRRFELTNVHYATQGVDYVRFFDPYYHAVLFTDKNRRNYSYDVDQNGRYFIRYNEAEDNDTEADYIFIHFALAWDDAPLHDGGLYLQGAFTDGRFDASSRMTYNPQTQTYEAVQLLKQGAYNYMYLYVPDGGAQGSTLPVEGNSYETENEYMILVYHRPFGGRYDRLIGRAVVKFQQ